MLTIIYRFRETQKKTVEPAKRAARLLSVPRSWRRRSQPTASFLQSIYHAFSGLLRAIEKERNLKIHCCVVLAIAIAATVLKVDLTGWALLTLAAGTVITAELINTALEHLVDLACNGEFSRLARNAKDTAAAAVLCAAFMAGLLGLIVFLPRVYVLLAQFLPG